MTILGTMGTGSIRPDLRLAEGRLPNPENADAFSVMAALNLLGVATQPGLVDRKRALDTQDRGTVSILMDLRQIDGSTAGSVATSASLITAIDYVTAIPAHP